MERYDIIGMSCAACSARVEKAVLAVKGVTFCSVNLLTDSMIVDGSAPPEAVIKAVSDAGYGANIKGKNAAAVMSEKGAKSDAKTLVNRLIASCLLLIALLYFSMGRTMWNLPVPRFLDNCISNGIIQMLLSLSVIIINGKFFINGFKGAVHLAPNMDTLVALGSGVGFCYSVFNLFAMVNAWQSGGEQAAASYASGFYFESAAMILALITVGKMLEARSKDKTTDAIKGLMELAPKNATLLRDGKEISVAVGSVCVGDVFVVRAGGSIPVDGIIIEGSGSVDESALTGESIPIDKAAGDSVASATVNKSGYLVCRATRVGEDTTLSQIVKMVGDTAATKAPIAKIADRVSGVFVPCVLLIAALTLVLWLVGGKSVGFAIARAITVLVISCPCALGLATPVAIMVGSGKGARNGILFKSAQSLECAGRVKIVALDKTGTITNGKPSVTDVIALNGMTEGEVLSLAYSVEIKSSHPLARAVVEHCKSSGATLLRAENFAEIAGSGVQATVEGRALIGGRTGFIEQKVALCKQIKDRANELAAEGKTPLLFAYDGSPIGIIAVADTIKKEAFEAVTQLKQMGIRVVMLTGDNAITARAIGGAVGVDEIIAGVLPDGKQKEIERLQKCGKVAMVGDGINDAPALTAADIGIAIGAGTDVAIDAADIVLQKSSLADVPAAIKLSRKTLFNIYENLFWAFIYNVIGIPLAAGAFISTLGWELDPMFGAAAMSLSSFCVVTNALRLNFAKIYATKKIKKSEGKKMEKILKIEGMMCKHCEMHVVKALTAIDGVIDAVADHESGTAKVKTSADVQNSALKNAVETEGYKVLEIK